MGKQPPGITQEIAQAFAGLVFLSTVIIYSGSRLSLQRVPQKKDHEGASINLDDDSDDEDNDQSEYLDKDAALVYPIVASVVLVGLWGIIKWFGQDVVNLIAGGIFGITGVGAVYSTVTSFVQWALGPRIASKIPKYTILMTQGVREIFAWKVNLLGFFVIPLAFLPPVFYVFNHPFKFTQFALNGGIIAFCLGVNALKLVKLDSFRTGVYLLSGLLVYDVWWVFGTSVMVDVATSLDLPIKLLWPKNAQMSRPRDFVLLGLGDVVIPGFFVALALRFDQARFLRSASASARAKGAFAKPYFITTLVAYTSSLSATMFIMQYTGHAQPALLYLSPACLLSFVAVATARGELREAWDWDGEPKRDSIDVNSLPEAIPKMPPSESTKSPPPEEQAGATENEAGSSTAGVTHQSARKRRVGDGTSAQ